MVDEVMYLRYFREKDFILELIILPFCLPCGFGIVVLIGYMF